MDPKPETRAEFLFTVCCFLVTILLIVAAVYIVSRDTLFRTTLQLSLQAELLAYQYVDEVSPDGLFRSAWRRMQQVIPFPVALSGFPDTSEYAHNPAAYGLRLLRRDGRLVVYSVLRESPLYDLLLPGDTLDVAMEPGRRSPDIRKLLERQRGDSARICFTRDGAGECAQLWLPDLRPISFLQIEKYDDIAYFSLGSVNQETAPEMASLLEKAVDAGAEALILDLRQSLGGPGFQTDPLVDLLLARSKGLGRSADSARSGIRLPLALLIAASTRGAAREVAEKLSGAAGVITIGSPAIGPAYPNQPLKLRSGETLYVPNNRHRVQPYKLADSNSTGPPNVNIADRRQHWFTLEPDIVSVESQTLPLVADLKSRHLFFDFVLSSDYDSLPAEDQELILVREFLQFLADRDYYYEPLGDLAAELAAHDLSPALAAAVNRLRSRVAEQGYGDPVEVADQVTFELLCALWEVKLGLLPTIPLRLRAGDRALATAIDYLQQRRHHPVP